MMTLKLKSAQMQAEFTEYNRLEARSNAKFIVIIYLVIAVVVLLARIMRKDNDETADERETRKEMV